MTEVLLDVVGLEAGYEAPVVGPVSFRIRRGEILGLAGPNGSGKSTLLRAIADHARIFAGTIERRRALTLSWMEQQPVRFDEMPFSGREYLHFAEADQRTPPERLLRWLDQRVDSLSGGQFQLLSCWTVLGSGAELMMLDEPTNNLDKESEEVLATLLGNARDEHGILLVSHDRGFLERVCSQMLDIDS